MDRHPIDGTPGCLDALYALAYLSSGDPDRAQQIVIAAFTGLCQDRKAKPACRRCLWRTLADHVRLATEGGNATSSRVRAPFQEGALPPNQRETIALLLGGQSERDAARLLGLGLETLRRYSRAGLRALQPTAAM